VYLKTARHNLPYVIRPSAEQLDSAYADFKSNPCDETRDALLLLTQRYSLSHHRFNDSLSTAVMVQTWRSLRPTTASDPLTAIDSSKSAFSSWLYRVVACRAVDDWRRSKPREVATENEKLESIACIREDPFRSQGRSWTKPALTCDENSERIPAKLYSQLEGK
jgi:hypothetical protein